MKLDHIENLEIDLDDEDDYLFDAINTLANISQGLFWLNYNVVAVENNVRQQAKEDDVLIGVVDGILKDLPMEWLSCAFQWYAVSLYNYVRLTGWLASKDSQFALAYVNRVIPRVKSYRHKIAAHFAITYPKGDNEADLISSIMTNIVYTHGYLRAGAMSEIVTDANGNEVKQSTKTSWSMSKVHNRLLPRFWPNGPIKAHTSIKLSAGATRNIRIDWKE
jgi:hypothetical protein